MTLLSSLNTEASPCDEALLNERISFVVRDRTWAYDKGPKEWMGRTLEETKIECDLPRCTPQYMEFLRRTLQLPLHIPLTEERLIRAWKYLMQMGLFRPDSYFIFSTDLQGQRRLKAQVRRSAPSDLSEGPSLEKSNSDTSPSTTDLLSAEAPKADNPRADHPTYRAEDHLVTLYICARGHTIIQDLEIKYSDHWGVWQSIFSYPKQFTQEIRKRLNLKKGGIFPQNEDFLRAQEGQVRSLYERLGYQNTKVKIIPRYLDKDGKKVSVDVIIREGERPQVGLPLVKSSSGLIYADIAQFIVPDVFFDIWLNFFSIFGVGQYDRKSMRDRAEQLQKYYRDQGWYGARVRLVGEVKDGSLIRPKVVVERGERVEVYFVGHHALSEQDLKREVTFINSGAFDEVELEQSRRKIIDLYRSLGHYFVEVQGVIKRRSISAPPQESTSERAEVNDSIAKASIDGDPSLDAQVEITFFIDEGPLVYVGGIEFKGMSAEHRDLIKRVMQTKGIAPDGVIKTLAASSGILQNAKLNQDLIRVLKYYNEMGFSNAVFRCDRNKEVDSAESPSAQRAPIDLWSTAVNRAQCFQVISDRARRSERHLMQVVIEIDEGLRTTVDAVDISRYLNEMNDQMRGDAVLLLKEMGFIDDLERPQKNIGLSLEKLEGLRQILLRYFRTSGYLKSSVHPRCHLRRRNQSGIGRAENSATAPAPKTVECDLTRLYGRKIKEISFETSLGPRAKINGVILRGHLQTQDRLIEDEVLLKSGMPLSANALFLSQTNLRNLGLFRSVNIESIGLTQAQSGALIEPVTLVVSVEELPPQQFDLALGLKVSNQPQETQFTNLGILYSVNSALRHLNVAGLGLETGVGLDLANPILNALDFQSDLTSVTAGTFFKNPRFFSTQTQLGVEATFDQNISAQGDRYVRKWNLTNTFSYDLYHLTFPSLLGKGVRLNLSFDVQSEQNRLILSGLDQRAFDEWLPITTKTSPTFTIEKRDNPIHPTRGFFISTNFDWILAWENWGILANSTRWTLKTQGVWSGFKRKLIFAPTFQIGAATQSDETRILRSDFLFKAGGDRALYPVRGYTESTIDTCLGREAESGPCVDLYNPSDVLKTTPRLVDGLRVINLNLEVRFPSFLISNIWLAAFNDWGGVSQSFGDLTWDRVYPSAGFGVRWLITGQIPLRVDVAWPLRTPPGGTKALNWNIFYTL